MKRIVFALRSLCIRLSLVVGAALSLVFLLIFYITFRAREAEVLSLKQEEATILAETLKGSLKHAMRQGDAGREAIQRAIEEVSLREEIEQVRIFDADGEIRYSSQPAERGTHVSKEAENCRRCHAPGQTRHPGDAGEREGFFYTPSGDGERPYRVLGVINPIYNERDKGCVSCHHSGTVLGVLDVVVSLRRVDEQVSVYRKTLAATGILGAALIMFVTWFLMHVLVHRPVKGLAEGAKKVGLQDLSHRLPADRTDELGNLARAFNEMTANLEEARAEVREFALGLEKKVADKTEELRATQAQMVRAEKMAAIGQMAAGVAHEINNPLTGVITFAHLMRKRLPPDGQERKDLETIIAEAQRCSKIARGLLDFARSGDLDRRPANLGDIVDRALAIVEHQAVFHNIMVERRYEPRLPRLAVDQSRMEQVFLNLIVNAAEAMDGRGRLTLSTWVSPAGDIHGPEIVVEVADTGPGIPDEIRERIFDPFFTTKPAGKGTGLGLSVTYRIVEDHGGRILLASRPGEGARFQVCLPLPANGAGA